MTICIDQQLRGQSLHVNVDTDPHSFRFMNTTAMLILILIHLNEKFSLTKMVESEKFDEEKKIKSSQIFLSFC